MSQKNETTVLVLALLITVGLVGGGFWWFSKNSGLGSLIGSKPNNPSPGNNSSSPTPSSTPGQSNLGNSFDRVQNVPSGLFSYGGSTTWAPIRRELDPAIEAAQPNFRLRYTNPTTGTPGSGSGIKMLLSDQLAFSQSSRAVQSEEYQQAKVRGFALQEVPVAIDGIAIAVNPNLNIPGMTVSQLKDIYTGSLTNWNQIGGPNLPISPYSRRVEDSGTVQFFVENVLGGQKLGTSVKPIPTTTEALRQVSANLGAIYYASAPELVPQCGVKPLPLGQKADMNWFHPTSRLSYPRPNVQDSAIS